jgi:hypothetical protein
VTLYYGNESLDAALSHHGGYVGLLKVSDNFKRVFNVSKEVSLSNLPPNIPNRDINDMFKKYGAVTNVVRSKGYIDIVSYL